MATLTVAVALLLIITVSTLFVSRSQLFDMKTASNHYRHTQAFEMAERGLEQTVAWLQERAAVPDDQNAACTSGQVVPIRKAVWECKAGVPAGDCDTYEYLAVPAAGAVNHCNAGHPDIKTQALVDATFGTVATYDVAVTVRRKKGVLSETYRFDVIAEAKTAGYDSSDDPYKSRASVRQSVALNPLPGRRIPENPGAPILVRDVVSVQTSVSSVCAGDCSGSSNIAVATLQPDLSGFDSRTLQRLTAAGKTVEAMDALTFTVFDILFRGATLCELEAISRQQKSNPPPGGRTVYVYGGGPTGGGCTSSPEAHPSSLPVSANSSRPFIVIVARDAYTTSCPKPGGTTYGIYYYGRDCSANGWGNVQLNGTVGVEGSFLNLSGSTSLNYNGTTHTGGNEEDVVVNVGNLPPGQLARIPGSWRDF